MVQRLETCSDICSLESELYQKVSKCVQQACWNVFLLHEKGGQIHNNQSRDELLKTVLENMNNCAGLAPDCYH